MIAWEEQPRTLEDHVGLEHYGTVALVRPRTDEARTWLEEHTEGTWFSGALAVEPRYLENLLTGLAEALNLEV